MEQIINLPTNREGYDKSETTAETVSKRRIFLGWAIFPPFPPKRYFSNSSKKGFKKIAPPHFDASFHADHDGGLGFFSSATVCWQINFVRLASQNHFLEKVDLF